MTDKWDKERRTVPAINHVFCYKKYIKEFRRRMFYNRLNQRIGGGPEEESVARHKAVFGRQSYCWQGEYKFWVWDFQDWRIYVSNIKGISIEVDPSFDINQTMFILRFYWDKMGL